MSRIENWIEEEKEYKLIYSTAPKKWRANSKQSIQRRITFVPTRRKQRHSYDRLSFSAFYRTPFDHSLCYKEYIYIQNKKNAAVSPQLKPPHTPPNQSFTNTFDLLEPFRIQGLLLLRYLLLQVWNEMIWTQTEVWVSMIVVFLSRPDLVWCGMKGTSDLCLGVLRR